MNYFNSIWTTSTIYELLWASSTNIFLEKRHTAHSSFFFSSNFCRSISTFILAVASYYWSCLGWNSGGRHPAKRIKDSPWNKHVGWYTPNSIKQGFWRTYPWHEWNFISLEDCHFMPHLTGGHRCRHGAPMPSAARTRRNNTTGFGRWKRSQNTRFKNQGKQWRFTGKMPPKQGQRSDCLYI